MVSIMVNESEEPLALTLQITVLSLNTYRMLKAAKNSNFVLLYKFTFTYSNMIYMYLEAYKFKSINN